MLAVLLGAGWVGLQQLISPLKATAPPCNPTTVTGQLASDQVYVNVYNGGSTQGLAAKLQTQLKGKGFNVPKIGNYADTVLATTIVGGTDNAPEVLLVAGFFPDADIVADGRLDHTVDVLVGDSFTTFNTNAPSFVEVTSAVICSPTGQVTSTLVPSYQPTDATEPPSGTPTS